jgi:cytoplasmic iron level regulating protein YaaA (DUF328/UPF0246 family)
MPATMLIVLSPAKTLDYTTPPPPAERNLPRFRREAGELVASLRDLTPADLSQLMSISEALAVQNADRYQRWSSRFTTRNSRQAIFAFDGDVYEGLDAWSLTPQQISRAQARIRILSGLYGLLRPLDLMQPYRLEMGTRLANARGKDLYRYWGPTIAAQLARELAGDPHPVLVNLASEEYFKSVDLKALGRRVVQPVFEEWREASATRTATANGRARATAGMAGGDGQWKVISFHAKRARGLMARHAVENDIGDPEVLKRFDADGYRFMPSASTADRWVFRRR